MSMSAKFSRKWRSILSWNSASVSLVPSFKNDAIFVKCDSKLSVRNFDGNCEYRQDTSRMLWNIGAHRILDCIVCLFCKSFALRSLARGTADSNRSIVGRRASSATTAGSCSKRPLGPWACTPRRSSTKSLKILENQDASCFYSCITNRSSTAC